jgi:glycosyltransferase 2 family protein
LLRVLVAVALTAYVLWHADPEQVLAATRSADLRWIAGALGLVLLDRTLMALRWMDLLSALTPGSRPRTPVVMRIFFVSSFVSNFVPGVAADLYRAYALSQQEVKLAESTASVLMDRVLGVLSMVIVGGLALLFAGDMGMRRELAVGLGLAFSACAAAAAVVFSERAALIIVRVANLLPSVQVHRVTASLLDAVRRYARHHLEMFRVLGMSIAVQALRVLQAWCLGRALGIDLPLATYFALIPVILIVMQLPLPTINGLGTTQLAFDRLFVPIGVAAPQVFALSVLFLVLGVVGSLPGGLLYAAAPSETVPNRSRA